MTDDVISHRALKFIEAVKEAYDGGKGYNGVAVKLGTSSHRIRYIMERHWPGSIRPQKLRRKGRGRSDEQMSLRSLGQFNVGDCTECRVPLVSKIEHIAGSQTCGYCLPGAARPR